MVIIKRKKNKENNSFFINHNTKRTTWEDPRFSHPPPVVVPARVNAPYSATGDRHAAAAQLLNQTSSHDQRPKTAGHPEISMTTRYQQYGSTTKAGDSDSSSSHESSEEEFLSSCKADDQKYEKLKAMFPSAPDFAVRSALASNNNSFGMAVMELGNAGYKKHDPNSSKDIDTIINKLTKRFHMARYDIIRDIVAACNNNESEAANQLKMMGYKDTGDQGSKSTSPKKTTTASPKKSPPAKSEAEKQQIRHNLEKEFPNESSNVLDTALNVCQFDEAKARTLIKRMMESQNQGPGSSSTSSTNVTGTDVTMSFSGGGSIEPVTLNTDAFDPVSMTTEPSKTSKTDSKTGTKGKTSKTSSPRSSPSRQAASPVRPHQTRAKQVTQMSEQLVTSTNDVLNHIAVACCFKPGDPSSDTGEDQATNQSRHKTIGERTVVTSQPHSISAYRTIAKGPDPSLRVGPNKDLLLTSYSIANGPNPEIRSGPDQSRVHGPAGAVGPDPTLPCGPQSMLLHGHDAGNRTLVTNI
ncbi:hypothetical protein KUTeg_021608 [Tegillarca granosa]|uniref:WW domain-containing protein n=1 Tax=Tegillarca granosa TaxID=220873 RepID=A0ABQ9E6Y8_TEGGR|nr:hypothetical protein KUTeg_021608 [Tegillarca granosa]